MRLKIFFIVPCIMAIGLQAQDTIVNQKFTAHIQATTISQYHPSFTSPYAGQNSLQSNEPVQTSLTATGFLGYHPNKHWYFIFNPEIAGGKGFSQTTGMAGFSNGEIYRVGNPTPQIFIARCLAEYRMPLTKRIETTENEENGFAEKTYKDYISVVAGKFSLTDYFDNCEASDDPRTQFLNWSIMANGAWDYAANTRGYTFGLIFQYIKNNWGFRLATTALPTEANGASLHWKWNQEMSTIVEIEKEHIWYKNPNKYGTFHIGFYQNIGNMGNYAEAIKQNNPLPDITLSRTIGRTKNGVYTSFSNRLNNYQLFIRASYNDGLNESWAFTEIDQSVCLGLSKKLAWYKRKHDVVGLAFVSNGLSSNHKKYLQQGGYGFIIGDGQLNYSRENIMELYYAFYMNRYLTITPDYQFIQNPAYNADRGAVHVFSLRVHAAL